MKIKEEDRLLIEQRLTRIETTLLDITTNHLLHLSEDLKECKIGLGKIDVKLAYWSGSIVATIWILDKFIK